MPSSLYLNHATSPLPAGARPGPEVQVFHRTLPGYRPTPLRDMPALAERAGVGRVLVKDESSRLGLPAFKVLGASWATVLLVAERLGVTAAEVIRCERAPRFDPFVLALAMAYVELQLEAHRHEDRKRHGRRWPASATPAALVVARL